MISLKKSWNFRWIFAFIVFIGITLLARNFVLVDTLLLIIISLILFIIDSIYRDVLIFYTGCIALVGAVIASSIGRDPFNIYTLAIYSAIIFFVLVFIVLSWEKDMENESIKESLKFSFFSVFISFVLIISLSNFIIIERNIITLAIMVAIILFSIYFFMESIER